MVTYGGDEVSAIVLDIGTHTTRIGYAGEETPRSVVPTAYGWMEVEIEVDVDEDGNEVVVNELENENGNANEVVNGSEVVANGSEKNEGKEEFNGDSEMLDNTNDTPIPLPSATEAPTTTASADTDGDVPMDATPTAGPSSTNTNSAKSKTTKAKKFEKRYFMGESGVDVWRAGMEVGRFMGDGIITDPTPLSTFLSTLFHTILPIQPENHPLIVTEPAWSTPEPREVVAEICFEGEGFPGFYSACGGVLSAFSAGKGTALIVDIGADLMSITPISDGYAMKAGLLRQPLGMTLLNSQIKHYLLSSHPTGILTPHQLIKSRQAVNPREAPIYTLNDVRVSKTTDSWREYAEGKVVDGWREACCEVSAYPFDANVLASKPHREFEFPNGYNSKYGVERFRLGEMLFEPASYIDPTAPVPEQLKLTPQSNISNSLSSLVGLSTLIAQSIRSIDVDHRPLLLSNIVLVGSGSLLPGLTDRLNMDLSRMFQGNRVKIHAPGNGIERRWSGWLGGSVLASLGTFQQLWVGKGEWEEHGPMILKQRCK